MSGNSASSLHTWYAMPKKPLIDHPVRQVRTCLGHTQESFAKLVGCSAIAIQRIENGSLKLSPKMAYAIAEATNADPITLLKGSGTNSLDRFGSPYSKNSLELLKEVLPMTDAELQYYLHTLVKYMELLLIASSRAGRFKTYGVNAAIQDAFEKLANDFDLVPSIRSFLIEKASVRKRKYRVCDLRKFPVYAKIIGFEDKKSYRPTTILEFTIPHGWIDNYYIHEKPELPPGADIKLRGDASYIIDGDRPIPKHIQEAVNQATYWEIRDFRLTGADAEG
jgi:transcriptional regulator with XRE-family HTH domain